MPGPATYFELIRNPLQFKLFLLKNLPSAYFSGVRLVAVDEGNCQVSVPFKWFTKNPFRSTYFACLAMAAEMSTGILSMAYIYKRKPGVSMLVTGLEASYFKKATGITTFSCQDGERIKEAIEMAIQSGESRQLITRSTGTNEKGEVVAEFLITWSYKSKSI